MGKVGERIRRPVPVGVVVTNVGTPLRPGLGFALETRESRDGIRRRVLVGVVVTEVGTPLSPSYRRRESLDGMRWGVGRLGKLTLRLAIKADTKLNVSKSPLFQRTELNRCARKALHISKIPFFHTGIGR